MQTPSVYVISQADIDAELLHGTGTKDGKLRVYDQYQKNISAKDMIAFLKKEYGWYGHSHTFLDGSEGNIDYRPSVGMTITHYEPNAKITVNWSEIEKRLRQFIQDENYLTPEKMALATSPTRELTQEETISNESEQSDNKDDANISFHDPLAPAYKAGDIVYLDDTAFVIDRIGMFDVHLAERDAIYPIFRAENKERFEMLLQLDSRNSPITEFLSYDLKKMNDDLREVLTGGLLTTQDKNEISGWLYSGEGNTKIAQRLSEILAGRADTIELQTGEKADYFTLPTGIEVNILDNDDNKKASVVETWREIAMTVRTLFRQELDGFIHEPSQREPVQTEEKPAYTEETSAPENFKITDDDLGIGSPKKKFRANMNAIKTLKIIEAEGRIATDAEKEILSAYVGYDF